MTLDLSLLPDTKLADLSFSLLPSVIDEYLLTCKLDGKPKLTQNTYRQRLVLFCQYLITQKCKLNIGEITRQHVRYFLKYLMERDNPRIKDKKLGGSTINAYYRVLHSFFKWCAREGYIKAECSLMININPPKLSKTNPKQFTQQNLDDILYLCEGDKYLQIRNKAMVLVFLGTGLRLKELSRIKMKDFDITTGLIKVMGKGSRERTVRMGIRTRKAVLKYLRFRDTRYEELWQSEERRPMTRNGVQITIRRLCQRAKIVNTSNGPHTFRHTAALMSLRNGANIEDVKVLWGHSKIQTTQIYLDAYNVEMAIKQHEKFDPVDRMKL